MGTEEVAKAVRYWREQRGLSGRALAALAGVSHVHIVNMEAGRGDPLLSTLERLAKALGVRVEDLLHTPQTKRKGGEKA
jgi:transcriptional regulator with XRE-family HTH domain